MKSLFYRFGAKTVSVFFIVTVIVSTWIYAGLGGKV